jgi:hypothetical protein
VTKNGLSQLYINGVLDRSYTAGNTDVSQGTMTLGDLRVGRALYFKGIIDEIRIYERHLDATEVEILYDTQIPTEMKWTWKVTTGENKTITYERRTTDSLDIFCGGGVLTKTESNLPTNSFTCTYDTAGEYEITILNPNILHNALDLSHQKLISFW